MNFKGLSIQIFSASSVHPARRATSSKGAWRSRNWRVNSQDDVARRRVLIVVGFLAAVLLVRPAMAADPPPTQGVPTQSGRSFWGAIVAPDTPKQNRKAFWALFSAATATNILDMEYTQHLLHESPNAYETNPVYGRRPSRLQAYPISFGIQAGYALVAYGLQRRRIKFLWTAPLLYVTFQHLEGLKAGIKVQRQLDGMRGR